MSGGLHAVVVLTATACSKPMGPRLRPCAFERYTASTPYYPGQENLQ